MNEAGSPSASMESPREEASAKEAPPSSPAPLAPAGRLRRGGKWLWLPLIVIPGAAFWFLGQHYLKRLKRKLAPPAETFSGRAERLKQTVIAPTLEAPLPEGKSVIWCAAFQLAWDRLRDTLVRAPVGIEHAGELARRLNAAYEWSFDPGGKTCFAAAGRMTGGLAGKIRQDLADRFPGAPPPALDFSKHEKGALAAYGYFAAQTTFPRPFLDSRQGFYFQDAAGRQSTVRAFGLRPEDAHAYYALRNQVAVLFDRDGEYALELCQAPRSARLVVAKVRPRATLSETLAYVKARAAAAGASPRLRSLPPDAILLIPNLYWEITGHFQALEGPDKHLMNPGFKGNYIAVAMQALRFRLDRGGAEPEAETKVVVPSSGRRNFVFDRPFLIYRQEREAEKPGFVMWVGNAELLVKW